MVSESSPVDKAFHLKLNRPKCHPLPGVMIVLWSRCNILDANPCESFPLKNVLPISINCFKRKNASRRCDDWGEGLEPSVLPVRDYLQDVLNLCRRLPDPVSLGHKPKAKFELGQRIIIQHRGRWRCSGLPQQENKCEEKTLHPVAMGINCPPLGVRLLLVNL